MLFLVTSESKVPPSMPMEEITPKLRETWELLGRWEKEGKIVGGGRVAGTHMAYFVANVTSTEELDRLITSSPMYDYMDVEVLPLVSISGALEQLTEWEQHRSQQGGQQGRWPSS
ncbi:MAG: muconolactone delta-isomerase [Chloroflexota bacterium]|nr:MAG: muconolactone delta-isomerase [Chloroflexota bacterium]